MDNKNELTVFTPEQAAALPAIIEQMMAPVVDTLAKLMANNTQALNQLASAQQIQNDRLQALEKQVRLNTPCTSQQARYLNDSIKARARELLFKREVEDIKAIRKLSGFIRKSVQSRYGVSALTEIPRHEYTVAMEQIAGWNDMILVRDVVKEAREREKADLAGVQQPAGGNGAPESKGPVY